MNTSPKILVLDFETTGLSASARPVEVAWVEVTPDLVPVDTVAQLLNPGGPIDPGATAVHGITDAMVSSAPTPEEFFASRGFTNTDVLLVAHNAPFDARFLQPFCRLQGFVCTNRLARKFLPDAPNTKLATVTELLGINCVPTHRALADVEACLAVLQTFAKQKNMTLADLQVVSDARIAELTMPFGKHRGTPIKDVPRSYVDWLRSQPSPPDGDLAQAFDLHFPR